MGYFLIYKSSERKNKIIKPNYKATLNNTFVSLIKHLTTKSENFWFLAANVSFAAGAGHLEGSKGRKRLIRTTKDEVRSALSCRYNH